MATEHESIFFSKAKSLAEYCQTDEGYNTYDPYFDFLQPCSSLIENLIDEFINNCTVLSEKDRNLYINRLEYRLKNFRKEFPPNSYLTKRFYSDLAETIKIILTRFKSTKRFYITPGNHNNEFIRKKPEHTKAIIALKYAIEGNMITRDNATDIAKGYGHETGEDLYQAFIHYIIKTNRIGDPGSKRKLNAKIKNYEKVLKLLSHEAQKKAESELNILKSKLAEY